MCLRFAYRDVPFIGRVERQARRRSCISPARSARFPSAPGGATAATGADYLGSGNQQDARLAYLGAAEISIDGSITLAHPLTPSATVAGVVQL